MIIKGWIQSPAESKRQDVRWCSFRWSIPLSIDYVCQSSMDRLFRLLQAHIAYEIDTAKITAAFCRISYCCMILYGWIKSPVVFKRQHVRWCRFRWSIPLFIDYVLESCIVMAISTPSCSYCIWNRYCQNHHSFLSNFLFFPWFVTVEFNCQPCSNNKICDNIVFADQFRYQLTMFDIRVLVRLCRLIHAHIEYEISVAEITLRIWRISHRFTWFHTVEFSRLPSTHDKMNDDEVFADRFRYQLTMFEMVVLIGQSRLLHDHISYEEVMKSLLLTYMMWETISYAGL